MASRKPRPSRDRLAERLHAVAIRLLRRVRHADAESGLGGPALSALSVVVFAGPLPLGALARAEHVRPPTITRLVQDLERRGLVRRRPDARDGRVQLVAATARGRRLLGEGRARRVGRLAADLAELEPGERAALAAAVDALERLLEPGLGRTG